MCVCVAQLSRKWYPPGQVLPERSKDPWSQQFPHVVSQDLGRVYVHLRRSVLWQGQCQVLLCHS